MRSYVWFSDIYNLDKRGKDDMLLFSFPGPGSWEKKGEREKDEEEQEGLELDLTASLKGGRPSQETSTQYESRAARKPH